MITSCRQGRDLHCAGPPDPLILGGHPGQREAGNIRACVMCTESLDYHYGYFSQPRMSRTATGTSAPRILRELRQMPDRKMLL